MMRSSKAREALKLWLKIAADLIAKDEEAKALKEIAIRMTQDALA